MHRFLPPFIRKPSALSLIAVLFLVAALLPSAGSAGLASGRGQFAGFHPLARVRPGRLASAGTPPPSDALCRAQIGIACYSPQEIWLGYGIEKLIASGDTGRGQTIVIFDSFGSPTLASDLATFDAGFNLPPPPSLVTLAPLGSVPFDPNNATMVGWAEETSLDVQWAHAIAPGANIVLMTSPVAETEGVAGMPELYLVEQNALQNHLGQIWSQSWGATENTLFSPEGTAILNSFNAQYKLAAQQGISVFASAGDGGVSNLMVDQTTSYPFPTVIFPASSPNVTAVGGTNLYLTTHGARVSEVTWNDGYGATGGGVSQYFNEPGYQVTNLPTSDQTILNGKRGIPDISYNSGVVTGVSVYLGFTGSGVVPGWYIFGGTSAGSPQWAGLTADLNQAVGHSLGSLNPLLYQLGNSSAYSADFYDITSGNNSFNGLTGYNATTGWDPTTGWGSPNANSIGALLRLASKK